MTALSELLPEGAPSSGAGVADWLRRHPAFGTVVGETAFPASAAPVVSDLSERRARGERYWSRARVLTTEDLRRVHPLLRAVAVTGSAAYGEPEPGDDLDFLAITRTDSVWVFLAYTYLRLRLRPETTAGAGSGACFNYVMEEGTADREFAESRGLLFAREALTARPVLGESYYRRLVRSASWMRLELPRMYARWDGPVPDPDGDRRPVPLVVRALNVLLFPFVATYLQLQGLARNRGLRQSGRPDRGFRTLTHYRKLTFASARFERLRAEYEGAPTMARSEA